MSIHPDTAQTMAGRALARAVAIGVPMNIAVDDGGHRPAFGRMERS
ncbi:heme-binding protein [Streptomyces sp. CJ_13]|nr:heme-binding protein [Streptomyces sp. CJ_13]MBT1187742.1 heme-binding protein [Streptomyces sp. CJ_13]